MGVKKSGLIQPMRGQGAVLLARTALRVTSTFSSYSYYNFFFYFVTLLTRFINFNPGYLFSIMLKITCNIYQQRDKYLQTLEVLVFQEDLNYLVFFFFSFSPLEGSRADNY